MIKGYGITMVSEWTNRLNKLGYQVFAAQTEVDQFGCEQHQLELLGGSSH